VRVWKASAEKQTRIFDGSKGHKTAVTCVSYNPNGDLIIAGAQDRSLRLWSARNGNLITLMQGHSGIVHAVAFHTQNEWVVTGGKDKNLKIWRESDGEHHRDAPGHKSTVYCLAFDRETGCIMASGDGDGPRGKSNNVWLWNFVAGNRKTRIQEVQNTHVLKGHEGAVRGLAFGPHGHLLCSVSDDQTARLWKVGENPVNKSREELENERLLKEKEEEEAAKRRPKPLLADLNLFGAGKPAEEPEVTTKATYRRKLAAQQPSANPLKDFVREVQDSWFEFVLRDEIGERGTQSHQHRGPARRVNGGHQNVYGWVDDEQSVQSPREKSLTDSWLSMFKLG
jgi:WD40 repeat protein